MRALAIPLALLVPLLLPLSPASGNGPQVTKAYVAGAVGDVVSYCDEDMYYSTFDGAQASLGQHYEVGGACFRTDRSLYSKVTLEIRDATALGTAAYYSFWSIRAAAYVQSGWVCGAHTYQIPPNADILRVWVAGPVYSALATAQVCPQPWVPGTTGTITATFAPKP
jgi:hypothetical protein